MTDPAPNNAAAIIIIITHPNEPRRLDESLGPMTWADVKKTAEQHLPNIGG